MPTDSSPSRVQQRASQAAIVIPNEIWIVDDNPETRESLARKIRDQLRRGYSTVELTSREALKMLTAQAESGGSDNVLAVAVHLALLLDDDPLADAVIVQHLRVDLPGGTPIVAYRAEWDEAHLEEAKEAGATECVPWDEADVALARTLLNLELRDLERRVPTAARVFDEIDVGIGVEGPDMTVLWANSRNAAGLDIATIVGQACWKGYHGFHNRSWPCTGCTVWRVAQRARARQFGEEWSQTPLTGYHLLPVRGRIARVEMNVAPFLGGVHGAEPLAVIEANRFVVNEEWERQPAHQRVHEVLDAACQMGQEREDASAFLSVAAYYSPEGIEDLLLFDSIHSCNATACPKVLRVAQLPSQYSDVLRDEKPRFLESTSVAGRTLHRFLWSRRDLDGHARVLVEVAYEENKPEGLLTDDLRPYWEYVGENFEAAVASREAGYQQSIPATIRDVLASAINGVQDDAGLDRVLDAAFDCVVTALSPYSIYIRILDRKSNSLVKRMGRGPYAAIAPERRPLEFPGIGSSLAASRGVEIWRKQASWEEIRPCLGMDSTAAPPPQVEPIVSYATLPVVYLDHVLGTLNVQFDDDSLYSEAKREFLTAIARALGSAIGSLEWALQRKALARHGRALDEMIFARSPLTQLDEEERRIVGHAARVVFELTAAEMVLYYRSDAKGRMLRLLSIASHDDSPNGRTPPKDVPAEVGVMGQVVRTGQGEIVNDYCDERWRDVRAVLLAAFSWGSERAFCEWVRCEVAWPVLADRRVHGALVALSGIPKWLTAQDVEIVTELAGKTGLCLEAKHLTHQFDWQVHAKLAMNQITATMARSSHEDELYRLFLLAITAGECLGFNRAILLLPRNGDKQCFDATLAVGPSTGTAAETQWREAEGLTLSEKIEACRQPPRRPRSGDLQARLPGLVLNIRQHAQIAASFAEGSMAVRRLILPHLVHDPEWRAILCPDNDEDVEYVFVPLKAAADIVGVVVADRAFLKNREIPPDTLQLLQLLADEFGLILAALKQRRNEEEARIAEQLSRGVSYGLGSRVGLLEAGMSLLKDELQGQHAEAVARLERDITFFKRSSALSSGLLRVRRIGVDWGRPFDLNQTLSELIAAFQDPRIEFRRSASPVIICAEPARVEDIFLEILLNAHDFTDPDHGKICITTESVGNFARAFVQDNGPGIHPDVRDHLFEAFQCYPRSRRGLGLAYAKALAHAYGGDIELLPTPDRGAHFLVSLPLA